MLVSPGPEITKAESRALLVPDEHVPHVRGRQAAIQLQVVHAGYAEHGVDVIGDQEFDEITADIARHMNLR
jgi:hypothetical protein